MYTITSKRQRLITTVKIRLQRANLVTKQVNRVNYKQTDKMQQQFSQ